MTDRELIIAAAERVMGWGTRETNRDEKRVVADITEADGSIAHLILWGKGGILPHWNPLESDADALMLVDAMRKKVRRIELLADADGYLCQILDGTSEIDEAYIAEASAETLARAATLACLQCIGRAAGVED